MRGQMVRFGHRQWALIQHEADVEGVSASQFVRDAAYARALWSMARRGEGADFIELAKRLDAMAAEVGLLPFPDLPIGDEEPTTDEHEVAERERAGNGNGH